MDHDWFKNLFIEMPDGFKDDYIRIISITLSTEALGDPEFHSKFKLPLPNKIKAADLADLFRYYIHDCGYCVEKFEITCGVCEILFWDITNDYNVKIRFAWA